VTFKSLEILGSASLFGFFIINIILSFLSQSISFFIYSIAYVMIIYSISRLINENKRDIFQLIVYSFFLIFSLSSVTSYFMFYENPLVDHLGDVDQITYYKMAIHLSQLSYHNIWYHAFTEFRYSESPLFYAWIATIQKSSGLDIYFGALLQRINVLFFSSLIPGFLFLFISREKEYNESIKWAVIYGLFSFIFYYSGLLLRDVHLALIYLIGFYILTSDNYNYIKLFILLFLGLIAYYLRMESGIFFIAFLAIWISNAQVKSKWLVAFSGIIIIIGVIFALGGLDAIYNMAFGTIERYGERGIRMADTDSLGVKLNNLIFPFNIFSKFLFSQIAPFPFWTIFEEDEPLKNVVHLSRVVGVLFWILVWSHIIINYNRSILLFKQYKWQILIAVGYILIVSQGQVYERRLFQVYSIIYFVFVYISNFNLKKSLIVSTLLYTFLILVYSLIKLFN